MKKSTIPLTIFQGIVFSQKIMKLIVDQLLKTLATEDVTEIDSNIF